MFDKVILVSLQDDSDDSDDDDTADLLAELNKIKKERAQEKCKKGMYTLSNLRKFKGESTVAAILPSHMEVSYCTSGFFVAKPAKQFH